MHLLELTLPTPEENLALDEALLDEAEAGGPEALRFWESPRPLVVVGRSSRVDEEVRVEACRRRGVPVLRRTSGGAAIVAGPGCLMYALVLNLNARPALRFIEHAHRAVLGTIVAALRPLVPAVRCRGTSDLAMDDDKFSGNSVRVKRAHMLYHGTLLYDFPLALIEECLAAPPRQPDYRRGRGHRDFVRNLPLAPDALRGLLAEAWQAGGPSPGWPAARTAELVAARYARPDWNARGAS